MRLRRSRELVRRQKWTTDIDKIDLFEIVEIAALTKYNCFTIKTGAAVNHLEVLKNEIVAVVSKAVIEETKPLHKFGFHWLDIRLGDKKATVQWKEDYGFGVSDISDSSEVGYGEGPDQHFHERGLAKDRILEILAGTQSAPAS